MSISFELPHEIEHQLRSSGANLGEDAQEAYLVELYRPEKITDLHLAQELGLEPVRDRGISKRHEVEQELTLDGIPVPRWLRSEVPGGMSSSTRIVPASGPRSVTAERSPGDTRDPGVDVTIA